MFTFEVQSDVVKALRYTTQVPGRRDERPYMCGILAKKDGDIVTLCSTDWYVLSSYTLPRTWARTGEDGIGVIPRDLVDIMAMGKKGLSYEVKVDREDDVSHVTITELPFIRSNPAHTYESEYKGFHSDFTKVIRNNEPLREDVCITSKRMMLVLKVGKALFGHDTWCEVRQCDDGVYVFAHNPKYKGDMITHKLGLVSEKVRG